MGEMVPWPQYLFNKHPPPRQVIARKDPAFVKLTSDLTFRSRLEHAQQILRIRLGKGLVKMKGEKYTFDFNLTKAGSLLALTP